MKLIDVKTIKNYGLLSKDELHHTEKMTLP